jgi:NitT/TauT family transport system substrate-binding protein
MKSSPLIARKQLIAGLAAGAAAAPQIARGQGITAVRVASSPVADVVPLIWAQNTGLFRNNGLDVTLQTATCGSVVAAAVAGNAVDIGKVSLVPIIIAHSRGIAFTIIFPDRLHTFGPESETALIVAPDSPIRTGKDFNGKTIGIPGIRDSTWIGSRLFIDANGGDSSTVKFVEIPYSAMSAAILAGRVDAGAGNDPYLKQDLRAGKIRSFGDMLGSLGPKFLETAWVANAEYVSKNRDVTNRFARVIREAQQWCNAHPEEAADITAQFTGVDRAVVATIKTVFATELDPRVVQPYIAACAKYQVIPKAFDAAELFAR